MEDHSVLTPAEQITVRQVQEVRRFFRSEWRRKASFEGFPGLPTTPGVQPSLKQANYFFLGSRVDAMTLTRVA
jgi:hypothetical protein